MARCFTEREEIMPDQIPEPNFDDRYAALPDFAKIVLQICSVIYTPTDLSTLLRYLYKSNVATDIARHDYARRIEPAIQLLQKEGLLTAKLQCAESIVELVTRQAILDNRFQAIAAALSDPLSPAESFTRETSQKATRDLRIALYSHNIEQFHTHLLHCYSSPHKSSHPIVTICNNPFSPEWLNSLPDHLQFLALHEILKSSFCSLNDISQQIQYLEAYPNHKQAPITRHNSFLYLFISGLLLQGDLGKAAAYIDSNLLRLESFGLRGWLEFIRGNYKAALACFSTDRLALQKINNNRAAFFTGFEGLICFVALLRTAEPASLDLLREIRDTLPALQAGNIYLRSYDFLAHLLTKGSATDTLPLICNSDEKNHSRIDNLFLALCQSWINGRLHSDLIDAISADARRAADNGYQWLAQEYAAILYQTTRKKTFQQQAVNFQQAGNTSPLLAAIKHEPPWKRAIEELKILAGMKDKDLNASQTRLIWLILADAHNQVKAILPREQKLLETGRWSKGRSISLQRLTTPHQLDFLTEQDKKVCATLRSMKDIQKGITYYFDHEQALLELVGHPLVFRADRQFTQIDIINKDAELHVQDSGNTVRLFFLPFPDPEKEIIFQFESPTRLTVFKISAMHRRIAQIVGKYGLHVPLTAKEKVLRLIGNISTHLNIHSDMSSSAENVQDVPPDNTLYCHLVPSDNGFHLAMRVKPFRDGGPYLKPGQGSLVIIAEINANLLQVRRDFAQEKKNADLVHEHCPSLSPYQTADYEWQVKDLYDCLQLLQELQELKEQIIIEWPKGEVLKLTRSISTEQLYVKVRKRRNWFELDGGVQVDDQTILDMQQLLELIKHSDTRFVPLSDGRFLSLTRELYNQLAQINSMAYNDKGGVQLSPYSAPFIAELTEQVKELETDSHWQKLASTMRQAENYCPEVPTTLKAELRSYQIEGFKWMARLALMGCGACLADDMGLGKTIQALTVILEQASKGPSLVVAPTSVCLNWVDEAHRFAPTLRVHVFGGPDRQKKIRKLKGFDLLVTSYGLLQQECEILAENQWQVVVLDEAQAIKNMATKRSRAAMQLKSRFRLITTGTPIENNLGELWNLFRFINPGLLGSIQQFNKRFAIPIEKERRADSLLRLRKIINPFILRRLKSQVLEELPSRTEINLQVNLSDEETAFYEILRRKALTHLEQSAEEPGNKQIKILAEIMRLRRACCNPALVEPNLPFQSSKLALFEEIIDELLANKHKVLVFSQFVDHLAILRKSLDAKKVSYQYLDGGTLPSQRKVRVDAFQAGSGDVFLISLKAGGLGLNLTAANYVIHMDPWWNPAVEDQASDRAHRIGQKLPVTIYRLITKGTIEEKIVTLHQKKRELADSLLKGAEVVKKVTAAELLELLRND